MLSSSRLAAITLASFAVVACRTKEAPPAPVATTTSTLTSVKYLSDKLPARGTKPVIQHATRGGSGDTLPSATSRTADEEDTDRQSRKLANIDKVDCAKLPDNVGECDGEKFYFCDDKQLWVVDCNAEAKTGGASDGSCFEAEKLVDCLGCGQATDGTHVCCDFSQTVCCGDDGSCYSPK
jgi:hypothetical protein